MMKQILLAGMMLSVLSFAACSDDTFDFGNTLTQEADKLSISSADYKVTTRTTLADSVLLRSSYCYLGRIKDPETGAYITSELMTQFNILDSFALIAEDKVTSRDGSTNMAVADSCQLEFYMSDPTGVVDTLAAMKIGVWELAEPMEETNKYYSNYDPFAAGKIRANGLVADKMFSYSDLTVSDTLRKKSTYYNCIVVKMNKPYTAKDGTVYSNYGTYVMQQYYRHPEYFKNSYTFTHNVCPGFYVTVKDGEGVYTEVPDMCLRYFYNAKNSKDSIETYAATFAGTEEVLQTSKIENETDVLELLASVNEYTYLKAPAGLYTEVTLPVDDIYKDHEQDSILTAKISFQRINNEYKDYSLEVPPYVLMLPADSLTNFFEKKKLTDNITSYYTAFSPSGGYTNQYTFSNISNLVSAMKKAKTEGLKSNPQWLTEHPNWNKVLLVPIQLKTNTTSSTTTVTGIEHYVGIVSTKLVGGSASIFPENKLNIVYGKFNR
jgi:hypothetical protein